MNPNIEEKLKYIDRTYNDDLVHCNCKEYLHRRCVFLCWRRTGNAVFRGV